MSSSSSSSSSSDLPETSSELVSSTGSTMSTYLAALESLEDTANSRNTRGYIERFRERAQQNLMNDYFREENPRFPAHVFRERFRMNRSLFVKIVGDIEANFEWFQEGEDARGRRSFTALQKCTSVIRQLATGGPPDRYDDYLNMARRTSGNFYLLEFVTLYFYLLKYCI